ncbi:GMC oxidoreductase [Oceaniferula spumae]|uniref:GMC oxidoreductase n=1 Tax=Oceaniferula spumae TaxID=2979115 RepID=A0AAT9FNF8_9BACT
MISNKPSPSDRIFDLCIVGSGPAGMIVALEYCRNHPDSSVLLAEYGAENGTGKNELDDSINNRNPRNHHDPYECTNKGLGGTSLTWGGRCVMFDPVDFADRPVIHGECTWDLDLLDEVSSYTKKSAEYFECGTGPFNLNEMPGWKDRRIADGFVEGDVLDSRLERWSMPTRFAARYQEEIATAPNLTLWCGVEAREFSSPESDGTIRSLDFRTIDGGEMIRVKAKAFVLAAGAQESTRILLRNAQVFDGVGGTPSSLGKFYQGHVSGKIASIAFRGDPKQTDYHFHQDEEGNYFRRRFQFSEDVQRREGILNTAIWLDNPLYHDPSHRSGAMSMMYLAMITPFLGKRLAPPAIANSITKGKVNKLWHHIVNVIRGMPGSLISPATVFFRRYCIKRKLPGICLHSKSNRYALHFHAEQIPFSGNRITLADDGETLNIEYEYTDQDIASVIKAHELLDAWLKQCDCGKLEYWFPQEDLADEIRAMSRDGIHQSGTTRIGKSPEHSVLDRDLKVWGTNNLYVCSSSAFPTSGQANPTFLLGAFAARLAQHIHQRHA